MYSSPYHDSPSDDDEHMSVLYRFDHGSSEYWHVYRPGKGAIRYEGHNSVGFRQRSFDKLGEWRDNMEEDKSGVVG